ncbi:MAG: hypothetical protein ACI4ML_01975 [Aristaeellaceae bacterium]
MITWEKTAAGTALYDSGVLMGVAEAMPGAEDTFIPMEQGVVLWKRHAAQKVTDMVMRFTAAHGMAWSMMPAIQYDGNRCFIKDYYEVRQESLLLREKVKVPYRTYVKGGVDEGSGKPNLVSWMRTSIPGATYAEGEGLCTAMFLPRDEPGGAAALYERDGHAVHELHWPEQDGPLPLLINHAWVENFRVEMAPRQDFAAVLVFDRQETPHCGYHRLLDTAWRQNYVLRAPLHSQEELWRLGVAYAKLLYTEEEDGFRGFSIGFTWQDGAWRKRDTQKYEIGWCGQNASLANSLLAEALLHGDEDARRKGFAVLDAWLAAQKPTGLIPTHYDDNMYANGFEKTVDACNLGTAAVQLFEAWELSQRLGEERPAYRDMALRICDFALRVMLPEGRIGKSWLEKDLSPAVTEGTTGAFLTMALSEAARVTGERRYLEAAERSCAYYSRSLAENGYTTAGALDIFTIDKESCIPLLKSNLMLYRLTGGEHHLRQAEAAAWYLSTWQWHYSRSAPEGSLFAQMGYDLFGGTAVSIHGGMDPYALCYVHELMDLAQYTGHAAWAERARAIWRHGQQGISDGTLVLDGKAPRPVGSQDESAGTAYGNEMNAPSQWLVAWPTAFRLEALRQVLLPWGRYTFRIL